jgi:hypothetical protein
MTDHLPASGTPRLPRPRLAAATALLLVTVAACSPGAQPSASPGPSGGPGASPTPTAAPAGIEHPTGATDIVLRFVEGGGFVPVEWMATAAPSFTLYGDGTVVFRDPQAIAPEPVGNVMRSVPFLTVRIDEAAIQALLEEALGPGGIGIAAESYIGLGADIPTATFTVAADGKVKQVSVMGLSPDMHPQNQAIVGSLARFAEKLHGFANSVGAEQPYQPAAYRGILIPVDQPAGPVVAWPWANIGPAEFVAGQNEFFRVRAMTPAEVSTLGIPGAEGGLLGVSLQKDGELYTFALRPLLPDETA